MISVTLLGSQPVIFWLNLSVSLNIFFIVVTFDTFHVLSGWSNNAVFSNIEAIFTTFVVVHPLISWLKASAFFNIFFKVRSTEDNPVNIIDELKAVASSNILSILVTFETVHEILLLNTLLSSNIDVISVTLLVSQLPIAWLKGVFLNIEAIFTTFVVVQLLISALKADAFINIFFIVISTSESPVNVIPLLKAVAPSNILSILVTFETDHDKLLSKDVLFLNISFILTTSVVTQLPIFWLNATASLNIFSILVTLVTTQLLIFWLNAVASSNIEAISVTIVVFHLLLFVLIFWLNAAAPENIWLIFVTFAVFHNVMSELKLSIFDKISLFTVNSPLVIVKLPASFLYLENTLDISNTSDVSHCAISPHLFEIFCKKSHVASLNWVFFIKGITNSIDEIELYKIESDDVGFSSATI